MTKTIENLFIFMSAASDLVIILAFLANYKKVRGHKGLWMVVIYCITSLLSNFIETVLLKDSQKETQFIFYSTFTLVEYLIFSYFLYLSIVNKVFRKVIIAMSILFILFIIGYLNTASKPRIDSWSIGIETILIIMYSFWFLYEQTSNTTNLFIYNKYEFWVITGLLIYLAGSFFIYIYANTVDVKFITKYWFLTNVFYIIKNLFFGLAIYNLVRKRDKKSIPANTLHPHFL